MPDPVAAPVPDPVPAPVPDPDTVPDTVPDSDSDSDPDPVAVTDPDSIPAPLVLHFGFDRATILPVAARRLDDLYQRLADHPRWTLVVTGYASPDGGDDHNRQLSLRRALRVQEYLAARGLDVERIEMRGRGATGEARRTATITIEANP